MSGYIGASPVPQATQHRQAFTATASQTSFATVGYTPQFVDVYLNGVKLAAADYTATNGSDIVLTTGAALNDILEIVAYTPFQVASQTFTGTTTVDVLSVTGAATGTNLTLSGGLYVGGAVAANYLDDYEEGTFTPTISSGATGGSYSLQNGRYTKVGNYVYYQIDLQASGKTASGGHLLFGGLPFNSDVASPMGGGFINYQVQFLPSAATGDTSFHTGAGTNTLGAYKSAGTNFAGTDTAGINARIILCGMYQTA